MINKILILVIVGIVAYIIYKKWKDKKSTTNETVSPVDKALAKAQNITPGTVKQCITQPC